jgi:uncharacterized protein with LGFP repeats
MRALLATSLGVLSTATLVLPSAAAYATPASVAAHPYEAPATSEQGLPGSTRSLPLTEADAAPAGPTPLGDRAGAGAADGAAQPDATAELEQRTVRPFSLVGVVWNDAGDGRDVRVQVRTRSAEDGTWSSWRTLQPHADHAPSPAASAHGEEGAHRGATVPLWVGRSDGVQARVRAEGADVPRGLRLELVDPGEASERGPEGTPGRRTTGGPAGGTPEADLRAPDQEGAAEPAALPALPALTKEETVARAERQGFVPDMAAADGEPHVGPRPGIVIRRGWGADADLREGGYAYGDDVRMAFVHHTAGSNDYTCKEAPKVIRGIYRYHVKSLSWRDIGYNFLIDKCGTIYEGRAGGVTEPVRGAHTLGFNNASMGVAVLGDFEKKKPSKKATDAVAKLTAWKLGLNGVNAEGTTRMTSGGGKYSKGAKVKMHTVSGHRDGFATACPGQKLYARLPDVRGLAARLQGR